MTRVYRWPRNREIPPMRNPKDAVFLDDFVARSAHLSGDELTRLAREIVPYEQTRQGGLIDLDQYLGSRRLALERLSNDETLARTLASRGH